MGKGYNNYMCKKPFHPGSKANIKRAWMAEQKTENEKKKQEELKVQYEKEQDLYNNRALLSTESKDKLELNFMYQAPPGAKRERQKEDDEPEFKFEWQRKYNAPREDYAKGNADIKDQPFGIPVRNVRCIKCHKWGHINTDKECPLFSQASTSSMPTTSMDPMELMKQMKEDGYGLKGNVLGHHLNPAAANQQLIPSDESDPEMEFLKSLSASEKKKLLRKLKKLSKKQEKASRCKKKKSKKSVKSKSKSSDRQKKKSKKSQESDSSDDSGSESSSDESVEEKQKKKYSKKHSSKNLKESKFSESSDSELDQSNKSKSVKKISQEKKYSKKKCVKSDSSSDSEHKSKKIKHKDSKSHKSNDVIKDKNNFLESDSEFGDNERKKSNHLKGKKYQISKRTTDISSGNDEEQSIKISSKYSVDKKSRSHDKISEIHKKNRNSVTDEETKKIRTYQKERSSSESQDEKHSLKYESKTKHRSNDFEKQNDRYSKPQTSKSIDNFKHITVSKEDRKNEKKEQKSNVIVDKLKHEDLNKNDKSSMHEVIVSKSKDNKHELKEKRKNEDNFKYEENSKRKKSVNKEKEYIKTKSKDYDSNEEQISKRKKDEDETLKSKKKRNDFEQKSVPEQEQNVSCSKMVKDSSYSGEEENLHRTTDEQKSCDSTKKTNEDNMSENHTSEKEENKQTEPIEKPDNGSKNLSLNIKCNSPLHPDGFSHFCPQARVEANYVEADEEYKGKEHDDFRHVNREKRSPSVKQKYNN